MSGRDEADKRGWRSWLGGERCTVRPSKNQVSRTVMGGHTLVGNTRHLRGKPVGEKAAKALRNVCSPFASASAARHRLSATAFPPFYSTGKDDGIGRRLLISVRFNVIAYHRARVTFARNAYSPTSEWCKKKTSPLTYHRRTFGSKRGEKKKKRTREKMRNEEKKERVEVGAAKKGEKKKRRAVEDARERRGGLCIYRQPFRIYTELTNSAGPGPASSLLHFTFSSLCAGLNGRQTTLRR